MILRWGDIPKYWIWYAYIDFMRYAWGGLMINEFKGRDVMIGQVEVLEYYSLDSQNKWLFLLYQFLFLLGFTAATWAGLHRTYGRR
jgi:ATP-binding cassette subfamily G (WHITE) protein 2